MPQTEYSFIIGVITAIAILTIAGFFIVILIAYANNRKKKFFLEKESLKSKYNEQLLKSQLEMQEQTFNIISQELHDNVGQVLSLAKVQLSIFEQQPENRQLLGDLKESLTAVLTDLRDIARSLNSERATSTHFTELITHEIQRLNRLKLFVTRFDQVGEERIIPQDKKIILLRIFQEIIQNVVKHSHAKVVVVILTFTDKSVSIQVSDDGVGFTSDGASDGKGMGLRNITTRAKLIGGDLEIITRVNEGTNTKINIPYV